MPNCDWRPTPPKFVRRWAIQGRKPDGNVATTIFDILADRRRVAVYPATVDTFAVLIERADLTHLLSAIETHEAGAVPAWHAVHGNRLLGLRPFDIPHEPQWTDRPAGAPPYRGPMELFVVLPKSEIHIVYGRGRLLALRNAFAEILGAV